MGEDERWVALFSGGKDSYLAMALARERGILVDEIVTVDADTGSYLYHAPATAATAAIADTLAIEHTRLPLEPIAIDRSNSRSAAKTELQPMRAYLVDAVDDGLTGLVAGVVESRYQYDLLNDLARSLDIELVTPLWGRSGETVLGMVHDRGLTVDIVAVAADGLDRTWLGRRLDRDASGELLALAASHGIHPAGEGGEFETLVVDAPAFRAPIRYEAIPVWRDSHGYLRLRSVEVDDRRAVDPSR